MFSWSYNETKGFHFLTRTAQTSENLQKDGSLTDTNNNKYQPLETKMEKEERSPTIKIKDSMDPRKKVKERIGGSLRERLSGVFKKKATVPLLITPEGVKPFPTKIFNPEKPSSVLDQLFTNKEEIGNGSFGKVFRVESIQDHEIYAIKVGRKKVGESDPKKYREAENFWKFPPHKNLLKLIMAWDQEGILHLQTEFCLKDLAGYGGNGLEETEVLKILKDLIEGLGHLHSNGLVHNDIKPENVLLGRDGFWKLADFGLMMSIGEINSFGTDGSEGDARYLAPEVLNGCPSKESDVFSLGVSILEISTGIFLPSGVLNWGKISGGNIDERFFKGKTMELKGMIFQMINFIPDNRPTCEELKDHPILSSRWKNDQVSTVKVSEHDTLGDVFSGVTSTSTSEDLNSPPRKLQRQEPEGPSTPSGMLTPQTTPRLSRSLNVLRTPTIIDMSPRASENVEPRTPGGSPWNSPRRVRSPLFRRRALRTPNNGRGPKMDPNTV